MYPLLKKISKTALKHLSLAFKTISTALIMDATSILPSHFTHLPKQKGLFECSSFSPLISFFKSTQCFSHLIYGSQTLRGLYFDFHHDECLHITSSFNLISTTQVGPLERELWEAEAEEDGHSSGYGVLHSSITTTSTTSTAAATPTAAADGDAAGTATPETDTGTDFGLLGTYTKGI